MTRGNEERGGGAAGFLKISLPCYLGKVLKKGAHDPRPISYLERFIRRRVCDGRGMSN